MRFPATDKKILLVWSYVQRINVIEIVHYCNPGVLNWGRRYTKTV